MMIDRIKNMRFPPWTAPLALFLLCLVTYGLMIPTLGYYWDDWPYIYIFKYFGVGELWRFFIGDRPLAAWTFYLTEPLIGVSRIGWHFATLLARTAAVVSMWWFLKVLWPGNPRQALLASTLFAIYPLFMQQPIAVTYQQLWIQFTFYFLSMGLMVQATRNLVSGRQKERKFQHPWVRIGFSLILMLSSLLISEYFAGVELLRPLFLWMVLGGDRPGRKRLLEAIRYWLPYLVALILFATWRINYALQAAPANSDRNPPGLLFDFLNKPLATLVRLVEIALQDTLYITITSWFKTLQPSLLEFDQPFLIISWAVAMVVGVILAFYLVRYKPGEIEEDSDSLYPVVMIGFLCVALGALPIWLTNRQVIGGLYTDRWGSVAMFGGSIVVAAILSFVSAHWKKTAVICALLAGLGVGLHLRNANDYRWGWVKQQRIFWQLYWRAPYLKPGTAIVAEPDLLPFTGDHAISFAINALYNHSDPDGRLNYYVIIAARTFGRDLSSTLKDGKYYSDFREFLFIGEPKNSLVIYSHPQFSNCLWILGPEDKNHPYLTPGIQLALPFSNLSQIERLPRHSPPIELIGSESEHDWCYFYQKANLARQYQDWQLVSSLGDQAQARGYRPARSESGSPFEWLPFIEGYAHTNRFDEATNLTQAALQRDPQYRQMLCNHWNRIKISAPASPNRDSSSGQILAAMSCPVGVK